MQQNLDRILTTHTGSLPRPPELLELLTDNIDHAVGSSEKFIAILDKSVRKVVDTQISLGLDIVNDGEQGRTDYTVHIKDRLTGFEGKSSPPLGTGEVEFPELAQLLLEFASPFPKQARLQWAC